VSNTKARDDRREGQPLVGRLAIDLVDIALVGSPLMQHLLGSAVVEGHVAAGCGRSGQPARAVKGHIQDVIRVGPVHSRGPTKPKHGAVQQRGHTKELSPPPEKAWKAGDSLP
jgi:hypothetical protein